MYGVARMNTSLPHCTAVMRSSVFREKPVSTVVIATSADTTTDIAKAEEIQIKFSNSLCLGKRVSRK